MPPGSTVNSKVGSQVNSKDPSYFFKSGSPQAVNNRALEAFDIRIYRDQGHILVSIIDHLVNNRPWIESPKSEMPFIRVSISFFKLGQSL